MGFGYKSTEPEEKKPDEGEDEWKKKQEFFAETFLQNGLLEFWDFLMNEGMDVNCEVQKLYRYRPEYIEAAEEKKKAFAKGERAIKKNELKKRKKRPVYDYYSSDEDESEDDVEEEIKDKNGKVIEYCADGKKNAFHFLFDSQSVNTTLFEFLIERGINYDSQDQYGFSPFFKIFRHRLSADKIVLETLLEKGVEIDCQSEDKVTPFLYCVANHLYDRMKQLINYGANINHMDKYGNFALKYAIKRRSDIIDYLFDNNADPLMKDKHQRNLLHHAINSSSPTSNADISLEQRLIK